MKWLLLLPLLLVACTPAQDVRVLQEQGAVLHAQYRDLQEREAEREAADANSCKAVYLAWAAMVKVGIAEDRSVDYPLLGCPTWGELNR